MTSLSTDTFNRTNSTTNLGSTDGDGSLDPLAWVQDTGTLGINTNKGYASALTGSEAIAHVDLSQADVDITLTISTIGGGTGLVFRFTDTGNYWMWYVVSGGSILYKRVASGAFTQVGTTQTGAVDGDVYRIVTSGSSISVYRNGVLKISTTDSFNSTATKHGFTFRNDTLGRVDDWSATAPTTTNKTLTVTETQTPALSKTKQPGKILTLTQTQTPTMVRRVNKTLQVTHGQTPTLTTPGGAIHHKTLSVTNTQTPAIDPLAGHKTVASGDEANPTILVKTVNHRGASPATLANMIADSVTWTVDQPDAYECHFPRTAYAASDVPVIGTLGGGPREIQIYRNGDLQTWGPIISLDGNGDDGSVKCKGAGVDWYLLRRFLDGLIPNLLTNPDFEAGTTGWTANGGVTVTIDTDNFEVGTQSVELDSLVAGGDTQIHQSVSPDPNGVGTLLTASAWFFIDTFTAAAFSSLGLYVSGGPTGGPHLTDNYYPIDNATPRGRWVKASTTLWIPPNETWDVTFALYGPQGTIHWDDCRLVTMDSVSTAQLTGSVNTPVDIADILQLWVAHVQKTSVGYSWLNIGTHCEPTGVKMAKHCQYVDHVQFDQGRRELVERIDGFDTWMALTPTTRTYCSSAGKRGTDRSGTVTLQYIEGDPTNNCTNYRYNADGARCVTRQVVIGSDNGPDREQGEAADASAIGGVVLKDVLQAPQGTNTASLQPLADERIAQFGAVPVTMELDIEGSSGLIPVLREGDLVTAVVDHGFVNVSGVFRIMQRRLTFATNTLTVALAEDTL